MTYRVGELYDALIAAKVSPEQASKASEAVAAQGEVATKADLAELKNELVRWQFAQFTALAILIIGTAFLK